MFRRRKELYVGTSQTKFSDIRNALADNGIKYTFKTGRNDPLPPFRGTGREQYSRVGELQDVSTMYYIYVDEKDFDQGKYIINSM